MNKIILSIVICTKQREDLLENLLTSLVHDEIKSSYQEQVEVIVVDNGPTANTKKVTNHFLDQIPQLRYTVEETIGLSYARNKGWKLAAGSYVAYVDDDCRFPGGWVEQALGFIREYEPAGLGGPFFAFYLTEKPAWYKDQYGSMQKNKAFGPLGVNESLFGGNMILRRDLIEKVGGFDPDYGMSGNKIGYGEENDLIIRISQANPCEQILYVPELWIYHLVPVRKWSFGWNVLSRFQAGFTESKIRMEYSRETKPRYRLFAGAVYQLSRLILFAAGRMTLGIMTRNRSQFQYPQNYFFEMVLPLITRIGVYCHRILSCFERSRV